MKGFVSFWRDSLKGFTDEMYIFFFEQQLLVATSIFGFCWRNGYNVFKCWLGTLEEIIWKMLLMKMLLLLLNTQCTLFWNVIFAELRGNFEKIYIPDCILLYFLYCFKQCKFTLGYMFFVIEFIFNWSSWNIKTEFFLVFWY